MATTSLTRADKAKEFKAWIDARMDTISKVAPQHFSAERLARIILTEFVVKTPELLNCSRNSVMGSLLQCAVLGLEPGIGGQCWIIPYKQTATFVMGYRGFITLGRRKGIITIADAACVRENDQFDWQDYPRAMTHRRDYRATIDERGPIIGAWSALTLSSGGGDKIEFLTLEELEKIRSASAASNSPAWKGWTEEMYKKSATKRNFKYLATEDTINRAIETEDALEIGAPQHLPENEEPADVTIGGESAEDAEFAEVEND